MSIPTTPKEGPNKVSQKRLTLSRSPRSNMNSLNKSKNLKSTLDTLPHTPHTLVYTHTSTQLPMLLPSVKLNLKPTQLTFTTTTPLEYTHMQPHMVPHTPPLLLDTHTPLPFLDTLTQTPTYTIPPQ